MGLLSKATGQDKQSDKKSGTITPTSTGNEITDWIHVQISGREYLEGVILDCLGESQDIQKLSEKIDSFASVFPISSKSCLLLAKQPIDIMLVAHHISKDFRSSPLITFRPNDTDSALELIQSYM